MTGGIAGCIIGRARCCSMTIVGISPTIVLWRPAAVGRPLLVRVHASGRGGQVRSACSWDWVMMYPVVGALAMSRLPLDGLWLRSFNYRSMLIRGTRPRGGIRGTNFIRIHDPAFFVLVERIRVLGATTRGCG